MWNPLSTALGFSGDEDASVSRPRQLTGQQCAFNLNHVDLDDDDLCFPALCEKHEEGFPISDAKYAEALQFQEAVLASIIATSGQLQLPPSAPMPPEAPEAPEEAGESSRCVCQICAESKETGEMFDAETCVHVVCSDCIIKHVETCIHDSKLTITCPGLHCTEVLELDACRAMLPKGVIDLWEDSLCQDLIMEAQRFYCPFKDCSALMLNDNEGNIIQEAECPYCHRLFCARCYVTWHSGVDCEQFQKLNENERTNEDIMVAELAKDKKWTRCPNCKFFVERTEGCPHMTCRCKYEFCYGCGTPWSSSHGGCYRN